MQVYGVSSNEDRISSLEKMVYKINMTLDTLLDDGSSLKNRDDTPHSCRSRTASLTELREMVNILNRKVEILTSLISEISRNKKAEAFLYSCGINLSRVQLALETNKS